MIVNTNKMKAITIDKRKKDHINEKVLIDQQNVEVVSG